MSKGFTLHGDKELLDLIKKLPDRVSQRRVWLSITREALTPAKNEAKSKVPVKTGDLKRAITIRSYSKKSGIIGSYLSVNKKKNRGFEWMKASVLAFGAKTLRFTRSTGKYTGQIKRTIKDFIVQSAQENRNRGNSIMTKKGLKAIDKEIKKLL